MSAQKAPKAGKATKAPAKGAEPAKQSPTVLLTPAQYPATHPLIGKLVTVTIRADQATKRKQQTFKAKVEYGDQTIVRIKGSWYWTSACVFS